MAHKTSLAMDPRVAAIMARLENQGETRVKEKETEPLPDELKTLDDFMRLEGLVSHFGIKCQKHQHVMTTIIINTFVLNGD